MPLADGYSDVFVPTGVLSKNGHSTALLILGEAPGREEDLQRCPFVGQSGQLLRREYVDKHKLADYADIYLTNVVRCRPPDNRTPKPKEINAHWPYTIADIGALSKAYKRVIVLAVGATAAKTVTYCSLTDSLKLQGAEVQVGANVAHVHFFATWHPAFILRDRSATASLDTHLDCLVRFLGGDRKSTRLNSSHIQKSRMPSSA